jgi:hypothetical protein
VTKVGGKDPARKEVTSRKIKEDNKPEFAGSSPNVTPLLNAAYNENHQILNTKKKSKNEKNTRVKRGGKYKMMLAVRKS